MSVVNLNSTEHFTTLAAKHQWMLVEFWSSCCISCQRVGIVFERVASRIKSKVVSAKANVDQQEELAQMFNIKSVPSLLLIHEGLCVDELMGHHSESDINRWLINHQEIGI